ncbi:hypothetical protein PMAYCL1PPCAC_19421, partial [Pristionchus mayeri]
SVCDDKMITNACDDKECDRKYEYRSKELTCPPNHRLFMNHAEGTLTSAYIETGPVKCNREGWTKTLASGQEDVFNFKDPAVDINLPVNATCKH